MSRNDIGVVGWLKNSFIDFPGTVSTVLFFRGCNLRCPWCHNPDIVLNRLPDVSFDEIKDYLKKRAGIIDGVVISGGEPTIHEQLPSVIERLREYNVRVKLDTNGLNPEMIAACKPDYLALDIKTDPDDYSGLGAKEDVSGKLLDSLSIVKEMGMNAEVRITAVEPFVNEKVIRKIAPLLVNVKKVYLQKVHFENKLLDESYKKHTGCDADTLTLYRSIFTDLGIPCSIRGL